MGFAPLWQRRIPIGGTAAAAVWLMFLLASGKIVQAYTVTTCASEFPGGQCDIMTSLVSIHLRGPIPSSDDHEGELSFGKTMVVFQGIPSGNYIIQASGCTPFGCLIDTPVAVSDQDVFAPVTTLPPYPAPLPKCVIPGSECAGDADGDGQVTAADVMFAITHLFQCSPR